MQMTRLLAAGSIVAMLPPGYRTWGCRANPGSRSGGGQREEKGKVRTVIDLEGDSCARMTGIGWGKKAERKDARMELDIERFQVRGLDAPQKA